MMSARQTAFENGWKAGFFDRDLVTSPYLLPGGAELDAAFWRGYEARQELFAMGGIIERDRRGMPCRIYPGRYVDVRKFKAERLAKVVAE